MKKFIKGIIFLSLAVGNGFSVYSQTNWINFNTDNSGLLYNMVSCIIADRAGNLWIGMGNGTGTTNGLMKFDGSNWTHYNTSNSGLPSNYIGSLAVDTNDNLWIGSYGLVKYDGSNWTVYDTSNSGISSNQRITSLYIDRSNGIWIGSYLAYVDYFNGSSWKNYNSSNFPIPNDCINAIAVDNTDKIWFGFDCGGGIAVLNPIDNSWVYHNVGSGLPSNYVSSIVQDQQDNIWIGIPYGGTIAKFDGVTWTAISPFQNSGTWVYYNAMLVDSLNNVWVGTRCEGLYKYDGVNWSNYNSSLPDIACSSNQAVCVDANNHLWYGEVYSGLWRADLLNGIFEDSISTNSCYFYPNPATETVTIEIKNVLPNTSLTLYTLLGSKSLHLTTNEQKTTLNVSGLDKGIYFINIEDKISSRHLKFIKQ